MVRADLGRRALGPGQTSCDNHCEEAM
jgi:hypothetical protein